MIQKLSKNRLERRNTQSTLLLGGVRYMINMLLYIIEAWQLSLPETSEGSGEILVAEPPAREKNGPMNHFCSAQASRALAGNLAIACSRRSDSRARQ